ncbi:MAG: hypothetical protein ACFFF4_04380 [Candidatus Thorarchaeota archaeon]
MNNISGYTIILMLFLTPVTWIADGPNVYITSESQYLDAFNNLQTGWSSETLYQTSPLGPSSICETNTNQVLVLDKAASKILELHLNGSTSEYVSVGNISLDAIAFQPNTDRIIGIGNRAFYSINETTVEVIKEHPPNVSFSTLIVNSTDDSIYTGHWMNNSMLYHFDANGEFISIIRSGVQGCTQVAIDATKNLLYYAETFPGRITQLNMTTNTTTTLVSGIAIPGTGEGIGVATDHAGSVFYYVAEGNGKGLYKYNGTDFENIMIAKLGTGPITWSEKFNSFLCTPGFGACVVLYDPSESEPKRLTPTVNTRSIIQTSDSSILIGVDYDIYKIESGVFSAFISDLPYSCSNLVVDKDENIYASLSNDSALILKILPDGSNTTWFSKDLKGFPMSFAYDSKNDIMVLMTNNLANDTFDLWRVPIDNPVDYSKITSIDNVTGGDFTIDRSGNIYVLERGKNVLYKIPDATDQVQTLISNIVEHAYLVYPHIAYSTEADAVILCRNDDLQAWPVNGSSSYILGISATGIDHEGLFENKDKDLVGTHSGQIFKLSYEDMSTTTTTTGTTTETPTESTIPSEPTGSIEEPGQFPFEIIAIVTGVGIVVIFVVMVCIRIRR